MRAFLSHSSRDKGFVEEVAAFLKPGTFELDAQTFDAGLDPSERRTNFRAYLETNAHYLTEIGQYNEAKAVFTDSTIFTEDERREAVRQVEEAVRQVEIVQAFKLNRPSI